MEKQEKQETNTTPAAAPSSAEFIQEIQTLKETTVPKAEMDKLRQENAQLIKTLASGGSLPEEQEKEAKKTSDDYAKELTQRHTNLEYAKLSLKQREKALEEGKPDPYCPHGENFTEGMSTDADNAQKAADFLQDLVDESGDNPTVFNSLLQARLKDDPSVLMHLAAKRSKQS